jgi:hypothetical protein
MAIRVSVCVQTYFKLIFSVSIQRMVFVLTACHSFTHWFHVDDGLLKRHST